MSLESQLAACPPSEVSREFLGGMVARMAVSYPKYGPLADAYPHKVDALKSMRDRVQKYQETGNTEFLVDAANFLMIEYLRPSHPDAHFRPTGPEESPGRRWQDGGRRTHDNAGDRT